MTMYAKFFARGKSGGRGPVEYLLYKDGQPRPDATLLRGQPNQIWALIDDCEYAQRYMSAVLSFEENDISDELRQKCMDEFEATLMPGLDADQYASLWVEHHDKNRTELHCVIPTVELLSGKRLQPFYSGADLPRVDAWKTAINAEYDLADPSDPRRQQSVTLRQKLPRDQKKIVEEIKSGLDQMYKAGKIKDRDDVIKALDDAGIDVVRTVKSSISIRPGSRNQNIKLTGKFFERDFTAEKYRSADAGAEYDAQRLDRARDARARWHSMIESKRQYNAKRHPRPLTPKPTEAEYGEAHRRSAHRNRQRAGEQARPEDVRAWPANRSARRTIALNDTLRILERCKWTVAEKSSGNNGRDVSEAVSPSRRGRPIQNLGRRAPGNAVMSRVPAFGPSRWRNNAIHTRRAPPLFLVQRVRYLLKAGIHATQDRAKNALHSKDSRRDEPRRATGLAFGLKSVSTLFGFGSALPTPKPGEKGGPPDPAIVQNPSDDDAGPSTEGPDPNDNDPDDDLGDDMEP